MLRPPPESVEVPRQFVTPESDAPDRCGAESLATASTRAALQAAHGTGRERRAGHLTALKGPS